MVVLFEDMGTWGDLTRLVVVEGKLAVVCPLKTWPGPSTPVKCLVGDSATVLFGASLEAEELAV